MKKDNGNDTSVPDLIVGERNIVHIHRQGFGRCSRSAVCQGKRGFKHLYRPGKAENETGDNHRAQKRQEYPLKHLPASRTVDSV